MLTIVAIEFAAVLSFSLPHYPDIAGATLVDTGTRCTERAPTFDTCPDQSAATKMSLPTLLRDRHASSHLVMHLTFEVMATDEDADLFALYLPKIADAIWIKVNGHLIFGMGDVSERPVRHWSRPVFARVSSDFVQLHNTIEIVTAGYPQEGTALNPFYFGPADTLEERYLWRHFYTKSMAQIGFAMMLLSGFAFAVLSFTNPKNEKYRWLASAGMFAPVFSLNYAVVSLPLSFEVWTIVWNLALHMFVCALYRFTQTSLGDKSGLLERRYWIVLVVFTIALVFGPRAYLLEMVAFVGVFTALITLRGLLRQVQHCHEQGFFEFLVPFICFSVALSAGASDWLFFYVRPSPVDVQIGHLALPLIMGISAWQIITDLTRSTRENEALNQTLQSRVDKVSKDLKESYRKLAAIKQREALDTERQRIMLELHDGVAGHLVNTLAYMQAHPSPDSNVQNALEGALHDLTLMIDSHELHDSLSTSLGMLRARLEPLLGRAGVSLNWQIEDELDAPAPGPSLVLNVLRIVQEAITNSIKHANASIITVKMDRKTVVISDDGSPKAKTANSRVRGINRGLGVPGMKKRAHSVSATFDVQTTDSGTTVTLSWA